MDSAKAGIHPLSGKDDEIHLICQYEDEIAEIKKELSRIYDSLLQLRLDKSHDPCVCHSTLKGEIFESSLKLKELNHKIAVKATSETVESGVRLPKLETPKFDGKLLNWRVFWEQFKVSVHERNIPDSEKLVYLQSALKDGTAKGVIEGLSRSGEFYSEAIESLHAIYDRPRLLHQTHVKMIIDAPALKDGNGREVRRLHDTVQQHLRALKALGNEPSGPFITSMLELKLDTNTAFEWHKYSQDFEEVPHYTKLLKFLNLRAQASEAPNAETKRNNTPFSRKPNNQVSGGQKHHFTTLTSNVTDHSCVVCKERHPLYVCSQFKSFNRDRRLSILRSNGLCLNYLGSGHFAKNCRSSNRCQKCQKLHHTLLHQTQDNSSSSQQSVSSYSTPSNVQPSNTELVTSASNAATTRISSNVLLMTCRVLVIAPDGSSVNARALLDSGSTVSFISERLAQALRLPRSQQQATIYGVAGLAHGSSVQSVGTFTISPTNSTHKEVSVTAVIVPRVTTNLPLKSMQLDPNWKHLSDIQFADPEFGSPGKIDLLLGVDVFIRVLLNGRRCGPPGSPTALQTEFG